LNTLAIIGSSLYLYTSNAVQKLMIRKNSVIISGSLLLSLTIITISGSSLSFAQQPPIFFANHTAENNTQSSNIFYKGPSLVGVRVYDYYKSEQWQVVQNILSQGFEIKSIIPASQLPNSGSPTGVLVILEKK
jgi:hypothetical protein